MTNHSYFNLNGHTSGSALGHRVTVDADAYLEADAQSIPTGRKLPVKGTPMDFTEEKTLGLDIGADFKPLTDCSGYDQCYVIRDSGLRHAAWAVGPETGIRMEVPTTLPGMHLYTANFLKPVTEGKDGAHYAVRDAVCLRLRISPMHRTTRTSPIPRCCPTSPTAPPRSTGLIWRRCESGRTMFAPTALLFTRLVGRGLDPSAGGYGIPPLQTGKQRRRGRTCAARGLPADAHSPYC